MSKITKEEAVLKLKNAKNLGPEFLCPLDKQKCSKKCYCSTGPYMRVPTSDTAYFHDWECDNYSITGEIR